MVESSDSVGSLKKDITQILADLYSQAYTDGTVIRQPRNDDILTAHQQIINLIESVADEIIGADEEPEKYDPGLDRELRDIKLEERRQLNLRNKLRAKQRDIKSKLIGKE